jgi:two-component system OmpR family response regulator
MPLRVLLIEDHPDLARLITRILVNAGYHVTAHLTAEAGLSAARAGKFDIAVVDHWLPNMTGVDLLQVFKRDGIKMPAIVISGDAEQAAPALQAGARDFMSKDPSLASLLDLPERVATVMRRAAR